MQILRTQGQCSCGALCRTPWASTGGCAVGVLSDWVKRWWCLPNLQKQNLNQIWIFYTKHWAIWTHSMTQHTFHYNNNVLTFTSKGNCLWIFKCHLVVGATKCIAVWPFVKEKGMEKKRKTVQNDPKFWGNGTPLVNWFYIFSEIFVEPFGWKCPGLPPKWKTTDPEGWGISPPNQKFWYFSPQPQPSLPLGTSFTLRHLVYPWAPYSRYT